MVNIDRLEPFYLSTPKRPSDRSRKEAMDEFHEFMSRKADFLNYFLGVLRSDGVDLTGSSEELLTRVGEWVVRHVRQIKIKSDLPRRFRTEEYELDLDTQSKSLCCYLAILFGDRLVLDSDGVFWALETGSKRDIDYHRIVVKHRNDKTHIEPMRVMFVFASTRLDPTHPYHKRVLGSLFQYWLNALNS